MLKIGVIVKFMPLWTLMLLTAPMHAITSEKQRNSTISKIDMFLAKKFPSNGPSASISIIKDGNVFLEKSYGLADIAKRKPSSIKSKYKIGSLTKQFTAISILQLVQNQKIALSDSLNKFFPNKFVYGKQVLIKHLLNHSSGIPNYTDFDNWNQIKIIEHSPMKLIEIFQDKPLEFTPGKRTNYTNSGYVLLGMIIEKVSKTSLEAYIQNNIFDLLEMSDTNIANDNLPIIGLTNGYTNNERGMIIPADYIHMSNAYAAGSIISTVRDLTKWNKAIHSGQLINDKLLALAFNIEKPVDPTPPYYGFGWLIASIKGIKSIEHSGGIDGYSSFSASLPEKNVYLVILSNMEQADTEEIAVKVAAIAIGNPYQIPSRNNSRPSNLKQFVGEFQFSDGQKRIIYVENKMLFIAHQDESRKKELLFVAMDKFYFSEMMFIRFIRDSKERITGFVFETRYGDLWRAEKTISKNQMHSTYKNAND